MGITATLKRAWKMTDASDLQNKKEASVGPGKFELERIPNPLGFPGNWLVLKGTLTGAAEGFWNDWKNGDLADIGPNKGQPIDWGEFEIVIVDTGSDQPSDEPAVGVDQGGDDILFTEPLITDPADAGATS